MNYNKYILEAINRGIKLALDDFDDEIQNQEPILSKKKIQDYDIKDDFDLYNLTVDLGLPSGTLWCKYNLGCDWEKLNKNNQNLVRSDWYGDFYAWGETEPKNYYDWGYYKFLKDYHHEGPIGNSHPAGQLSKYVMANHFSNVIGEFNDNIFLLLPEDDASYLADNKFRIPTKEQYEELQKYTTSVWMNNVNGIDRLNGIVYTSKINREYLFIPAAGIKFVNTNGYALHSSSGNYAYAWTRTLFEKKSDCAYCLCGVPVDNFSTNISLKNALRFYGMPIRPVLNI